MKCVSVVVPAYNCGAHLGNLIQVLRNQTYQDFDVIIVNDGSTDNSGVLLDAYTKEELGLDLFVIHQSNKGVSAARNRGMQEAKGKYICFLDADDTPASDYLELLVQAIESTELDVVMGFITRQQAQLQVRDNTALKIFSGEAFLREFLYRGIRFSICAGIYRRQALENLQLTFPEGYRYSEDVYLLWQLFARQNAIGILPCAIYYYYDNPVSAMNRKMDLNRKQAIELMEHLEPIMKTYAPKFADEFCQFAVARHHWSILWQAACSMHSFQAFTEYSQHFPMKEQLTKLFCYPSKKISLSSRLYCMSPRLYYHMLRLYKRLA